MFNLKFFSMCIRPIIINHSTKDFHLSDPIQLSVACGSCEECLSKRRNEFRVRLIKQMEYNEKHGINNYFCTLTYNEGHLPRFYFSDELIKQVTPEFLSRCNEIPCFSRRDIFLFRQSLQKWLKRNYKIGAKDKTTNEYIYPPINFFIVCEFGGQFGRPHYHMFLGVSNAIDPETLFKKIQELWQGSVSLDDDIDSETFGMPVTLPNGMPRYTDGLGFVYPPQYDGGFVNGKEQNPFQIKSYIASASYNAKYICKDLSFYKFNYNLCRVLDGLKLDKKLDDVGISSIADLLLKCIRGSLPFYSISQNFGACIIDELKTDDVKTTVDNIVKGIPILQKNGLTKYEKVPFYILRKMLFDIRVTKDDDNIIIRYDLNDYGTYYRLSTYKDRLNKMITHMKSTYALGILNRYAPILEQREYFSKLSYEDWQLLAAYKMTFRYRLVPFLCKTELHIPFDISYDIDIDSYDSLMSIASQYEIIDKKRLDGFRVTHKNFPKLKLCTFNNFGVFQYYDRFLSILDNFDLILRTRTSQQKQDDRERLQTMSHMFNN